MILVANSGDRPVQVGSHFHFFETNPALRFERAIAYGMRLHIPAGTAVRFEPGDEKQVELVEIGGEKVIWGFHGLVNGSVRSNKIRKRAMQIVRSKKFVESAGNGKPRKRR